MFGVFGSAANAPAYSLTREFFPPNYITTANSILALSVYFGGCISSLSIIFIRNFGWREDYNLTGLIGIVLGIACLTYIQEPKRGVYSMPDFEKNRLIYQVPAPQDID